MEGQVGSGDVEAMRTARLLAQRTGVPLPLQTRGPLERKCLSSNLEAPPVFGCKCLSSNLGAPAPPIALSPSPRAHGAPRCAARPEQPRPLSPGLGPQARDLCGFSGPVSLQL